MTVFDKYWFKAHQETLLRWLNMPVIGFYFRWVCGVIGDIPVDSDIVGVNPSDVTAMQGGTFTLVAYEGNKVATMLRRRLYVLWATFHFLDECFHALELKPSFGFDTLTSAATVSQTGGTISSNPKSFGVFDDWTSLTQGSYAIVCDRAQDNNTMSAGRVAAGLVSSTHWTGLQRGCYAFDLSSLPIVCNVKSAVLGLALSNAITRTLKLSDGSDMKVQLGPRGGAASFDANQYYWLNLFMSSPMTPLLTSTITNVDASYNYFDTADSTTPNAYNGKIVVNTSKGQIDTISTNATIAGGTRWTVNTKLNGGYQIWGVPDTVQVMAQSSLPPDANWGTINYADWATTGAYSSLNFSSSGLTAILSAAGSTFGVATRLDQEQPVWQSNQITQYLVYTYRGNSGLTPPKITITYKLPSQIVSVSGDNQSGRSDQTLSPFVGAIQDEDGVGVPNAIGLFALGTKPTGATAGSLSTTSIGADSNGQVSTTFRLGYGRGTYTVTLSPVNFTANTITFTATELWATMGHWTYGQMEDMARIRLQGLNNGKS